MSGDLIAPGAPTVKAAERATLARKRTAERVERVQASIEAKDGVGRVDAPHDDRESFHASLKDAFGTTSEVFATEEVTRILSALNGPGAKLQTQLNSALAAIDGVQAENEIESMLAAQMATTHAIALDMIGRTRRAANLEQLHADYDEAARVKRNEAARDSGMMPPTVTRLCRPGGEAY